MKLPNLPKLPFGEKEPHANYFLILLLRDEKVSAVIIEELVGKVKIIGKHEESFLTNLEDAPIDEWLDLLDKTISRAEDPLPTNIQTKQTVFGVKENWIHEKKIHKDYLAKLKKVCEGLDLEPMGFLVLSEAIANLVQEEEGAPVSAIVAEVGSRTVTLSLFKGGRLIETKTHAKGQSLPETVDTMLKHFTSVEVLPSRIIIFCGEKDDTIAQAFIAHSWSRSIPFLHMPQISLLPSGFDAKAVVFGAAEQMGFQVVGQIIDRTGKEIKTFDKHDVAQGHAEVTEEADPPAASTRTPAENRDFQEVPAENFGFVMDADVEEMAPEPTTEHQVRLEHTGSEVMREDELDRQPSKSLRGEKRRLPVSWAALTPVISNMHAALQKISLPKGIAQSLASLRGNKLIIIIPLVLAIPLGLFLLYTATLQASVSLRITTKAITDEQPVTFTLADTNDYSQHIIAAKPVSVSVEGETATPATGKKDVGEKAKGTVTFYNSSLDGKRQIKAGTTLTASNGKKFVLNEDVSVASASGSIFTGTKPGTAQGNVTAGEIGNEYNVPSNTTFTVSSADSALAAKNDAAFSGGLKKQVTIVDTKDIDKLVADLPDRVSDKGKAALKNTLSSDETLIPDLLKTTLTKRKTDKNAGEEAKTVTLKGTVTFESAAYSQHNIQDYAKSFIQEKYANTSALSDKPLIVVAKNIRKKSDRALTGTVVIQAGLLPQLDLTKAKRDIAGKDRKTAEEALLRLPQVEGAAIQFRPNIPFLPKKLPKNPEKITITTKNE